MHFDIIIQNGKVYLDGRFVETDIGIKNGNIEAITTLNNSTADKTIEAHGLHVLPGAIDSQVHFREPGLEHKEDLETGTKSALRGGITGVFEMPNTKPSTTTAEAIQDKVNRMKNRAWCDFSFYVGAATDNISQLPELEKMPGTCGVKIFMGSSTGSLLVPDDFHLEKVLKNGRRRVAIHAEDEYRLKERFHLAQESGSPVSHPIWRDEESALIATKRIVEISKRTYRPIHLLHVSSYQEMQFLKKQKDLVSKELITVECLPQYLTLHAPDCYERLGTLAQMNPPIRSKEHSEGLWKAIHDGTVDVLATDHAPHTLQEKQKPYPESPSGMPGVQTLLPIMLNHVHEGRISLEKLVELVCVNPAKIFGIKGRGFIKVGVPATLTIIDTKAEREITSDWLLSKCGWSPYEGMTVTGWPVGVLLKGMIAMWEDEIIGPTHGQALEFSEK